MMINKKILISISFLWLIYCVVMSVVLTLDIVGNPSPFSSSYWDMRWLIIFGVMTAGIALLFFLGFDRLLFWSSLVGIFIFLGVPIVTMGAGKPYLAIIIILWLSFAIGDKILQKFFSRNPLEPIERISIALLIGLSVLMVLRSIQGVFGLFKPWITFLGLGILFLGFILPSLRSAAIKLREVGRKAINFVKSDDLKSYPILVAVSLVLFFPSWLIALSPPMRYDEMSYHLSGAVFYLQQGGIVKFPEGGANPWLHYAEMLYTLAIELGGLSATRLVHFVMTALTAVFIFITGKRLINSRAGIFAALGFLAIPLVAYEGSTAYIDLIVTAFTTAFGYCFIRCWQDTEKNWLILAGIFGGIGMGVKLSAGPMIFSIVLCLGLVKLIRKFKSRFSWFLLMGGIILLFSVPWWVRDYLWRGDPFFPYGNDLIQKITPNPNEVSTASVAKGPSLIENLIRYPFDIVLESRKYYHEAPGAMTATLPFLSLPLWLLGESITKREKKILLLLLASSILAVALMMIANNALLRYALPIFPWLALSAAANIEEIYRYLAKHPNFWAGNLLFLLLMLFVFSTRPALILRVSENITQRLPLNYFLGRETAEDYLSRNLPVYSAFQFIDRQPGGRHRVLSIGNEFRLYVNSRIDGVWDVEEAFDLLAFAKDEYSLMKSLNEYGYKYILINKPEVEYVASKYTFPIIEQTDFLNICCELVFARRQIYVYRVNSQIVPSTIYPNEIKNPSFEALTENKPAEWLIIGQVFFEKDAKTGNEALLLYGPLSDQSGTVKQKLNIEPERIYTLSYWSKALGQNAALVIRLNFLDSNQNLIEIEEYWKNPRDNWQETILHFEAPNSARYVEVEIGMGNYEGVLFDDVCFAKGQKCVVGVTE